MQISLFMKIWWFWAQIEVTDMQTRRMHTITSADPALGLFREAAVIPALGS